MDSPKGWKVITYKDIHGDNEDINTKKDALPKEEVKKTGERPQKLTRSSTAWGDLGTKPFWKRNIFPVFLEAAFLILLFKNPYQSVYINFFFYLVLFFFYLITKGFTFRKLIRNWRAGLPFWKSTALSTVLFLLCIVLTTVIGIKFPNLDPAFNYNVGIKSNLDVVLFAITSMFLSPIVEEIFYRGNLISLESKQFKGISTFASILLFAIIHSFSWWGILSAAIWAIPLTVMYIKTHDVYITLTAHFFVNLIINIPFLFSFIQ